jgi:hypothetical protein
MFVLAVEGLQACSLPAEKQLHFLKNKGILV